VLMIPLLLAAPMTMVLYMLLSWIMRDKVRARDAEQRALDEQEAEAVIGEGAEE